MPSLSFFGLQNADLEVLGGGDLNHGPLGFESGNGAAMGFGGRLIKGGSKPGTFRFRVGDGVRRPSKTAKSAFSASKTLIWRFWKEGLNQLLPLLMGG